MATTRTRYVNTASTTGGDGTTNATSGANRAYPSLHAALTAEFALVPDLVTSDVVLDIQCSGATADSTAVAFSGYAFTVDSTRYISITGQRSRVWDTNKYRLAVSSGSAVVDGVLSFTRFIGMQIRNTGGYVGLRQVSPSSGFTLTCEGCLFDWSGLTDRSVACVHLGGVTNKTVRLVNNICFGVVRGLVNCQFTSSTTSVVYNNTVVVTGAGNSAIDFASASGTTYLRNNIVESANTCYTIGGTVTSSANISDDTSSPQTGLRSTTLSYANKAGNDYALSASDTAAIDAGTDLSADAQYAFSTDIEGSTRSGSWEIGAMNYVASTLRRIDGGLARGMFRGMGRGMR